MFEEYLPTEASWDGRSERCTLRDAPRISRENSGLFEFTALVAAKFLACLGGSESRQVSFRFGVREDSPGFIKLDVLGTMIIVGVRTQPPSLERLLQIIVRARQLSELENSESMIFVPIVIFGEIPGQAFYVESMQTPTFSPWFIKAAVEFTARRIAFASETAGAVASRTYLRQMETSGVDPEGMLLWQPLFRLLLSTAPDAVGVELRRQVASQLLSRL